MKVERGETASRNDVHFIMYIFQGTDAAVVDRFASLGPPLLPWENCMGRGQQINNTQRTDIVTTRPNRPSGPIR